MTTTDIVLTPNMPPAQANDPASLMALAIQHGAAADQLEKLTALQERWERNQAARDFADALAEFQKRCPPIKKKHKAEAFGGGKGYSFAPLEDVMEVIGPHLSAVGLSVTADVEHVDAGSITVITCITKGIHERRSKFICPVPKEMKINSTQQAGAAMKYARRYGLEAALNLVVTNEDTDGAGLGEKPETISEEQAIELADMADAARGMGHSLDSMWKWASTLLGHEVKSFGEFTPAMVPKAKAGLQKKLEAKP